MTARWKLSLDSALLTRNVDVWTTTQLLGQAMLDPNPPSKASFNRWVDEAVESGKLLRVRRGVFLNPMGNRRVNAAAAATYIRRNAVPSLSWVLEQDWLLNNFSDVVTCTVPMAPGIKLINVAPVKTEHGWFRFHTLPWRIHEPDTLPVEDWRDNRVDYPRATPEKAFADWLYLARSPRSWLKRPPYDLEFAELNKKRLARIIKALSLEDIYLEWIAKKNQYDQDPDVIANDYTGEVPRFKKPS
jgi:hypothetical protein